MTEPKETPRVYHANFFKKTVALSPDVIYSMCCFDECDIYVRPGDKLPETACHLEGCLIHLQHGVTPHNFLAAISQMKCSRIHGGGSLAMWERGPDFPTGSVWINCKIVFDGVERDMLKMAEEIRESIYGKDPDQMAWVLDNEKQRAERRAKTS